MIGQRQEERHESALHEGNVVVRNHSSFSVRTAAVRGYHDWEREWKWDELFHVNRKCFWPLLVKKSRCCIFSQTTNEQGEERGVTHDVTSNRNRNRKNSATMIPKNSPPDNKKRINYVAPLPFSRSHHHLINSGKGER